jgi:hypothetical protein
MELIRNHSYAFYFRDNPTDKDAVLEFLKVKFPDLGTWRGYNYEYQFDDVSNYDGLLLTDDGRAGNHFVMRIGKGTYHNGHLERDYPNVIHSPIPNKKPSGVGDSKLKFYF